MKGGFIFLFYLFILAYKKLEKDGAKYKKKKKRKQ
jgi:hypothetical protein